MDLDPLGALVTCGPGVERVGDEVAHPCRHAWAAEAELAPEHIVHLIDAVAVGLHPLTRHEECDMIDLGLQGKRAVVAGAGYIPPAPGTGASPRYGWPRPVRR